MGYVVDLKVKRLDQRHLPHRNREWCEEQLYRPYPTDKFYQGCKRTATYTINGKPYCTLHAGAVVLEHMVELTKANG